MGSERPRAGRCWHCRWDDIEAPWSGRASSPRGSGRQGWMLRSAAAHDNQGENGMKRQTTLHTASARMPLAAMFDDLDSGYALALVALEVVVVTSYVCTVFILYNPIYKS